MFTGSAEEVEKKQKAFAHVNACNAVSPSCSRFAWRSKWRTKPMDKISHSWFSMASVQQTVLALLNQHGALALRLGGAWNGWRIWVVREGESVLMRSSCLPRQWCAKHEHCVCSDLKFSLTTALKAQVLPWAFSDSKQDVQMTASHPVFC